jgi:hypothetical protein
MLLRLVCLAVTKAFAALRLLSMSARDKDIEILALRHQITVLERQLGTNKAKFAPEDRAFLATLLAPLPRVVLRRLRLIVRPDTIMRLHRDLMKRRHARTCRPGRPGRPPTIHALTLRLTKENPSWGYRRVHGELTTLGIKTAPSTAWEILKQEGIDPAPDRTSTTWADFLHSRAHALLACDFLETVTVTGQRQYVLAAIEHASRRIRILGTTAHPTAAWVTQTIKNLVMDLEDAGANVKFLIRDRDAKFPALIDEILADAGIQTVLTGVRVPRMNSIMERWVQSCRHELLAWTGRSSGTSTTCATPCASTSSSTTPIAPTRPCGRQLHCAQSPSPSPSQGESPTWTYADTTDSAASSTSTYTPRELHG